MGRKVAQPLWPAPFAEPSAIISDSSLQQRQRLMFVPSCWKIYGSLASVTKSVCSALYFLNYYLKKWKKWGFVLNDKTRTASCLISSLLCSFLSCCLQEKRDGCSTYRPKTVNGASGYQICARPAWIESFWLRNAVFTKLHKHLYSPFHSMEDNCKAKTKNMHDAVAYFCRDIKMDDLSYKNQITERCQPKMIFLSSPN